MYILIVRWEDRPSMVVFPSQEKLYHWLNDENNNVKDLDFLATKGSIAQVFSEGIEEWPPNTAMLIKGEALRVIAETRQVEWRTIE